MKFILSFFLSIVFGITSTFAQELTASASKTHVAAGEQFQISYSLNTGGSNFKSPPLNDFDVYSGPNQSTSMQFINGNMSQSISFSFIIAAKKEGKLTIPPASVIVNGKKIESKPIVIEAKGAAPAQPNHQRSNQSQHQAQASQGDLGDNLFLKCNVDKQKVYVGEQIIATFKIYTRVSIVDNGLSKIPVLNGFWSEDIPSKTNQAELYTENYEGVQYNVAELKKTILFPQRAGTLEIDPLELECVVRQRGKSNSIFDQFFGGGHQDTRVKIKTKPVKIEVMALPTEGKPAGFTGAVGTFSIESKINKENVKTNDAVNLIVTVSGKGNIKMIDPIKPEFPADIEAYDPKTNDNINASNAGLSGRRTYDFLLIPRHSGDFNLPAIPFSYFDPQKKTYITLNTPSFPLHVEKGKDGEQSSTLITSANQEDIKTVGSDIRYIKTSTTEFRKNNDVFFGTGMHHALMISPILLLIIAAVGRNRYEKNNADVPGNRTKKATRVALKRLELAEVHLKNNDDANFYQEVYHTLETYLGDKLHLSKSVLSKESIASTMASRNINAVTIQQFIAIMDKCEFARYAPLKSTEGMKEVYAEATSVIVKVEEDLK